MRVVAFGVVLPGDGGSVCALSVGCVGMCCGFSGSDVDEAADVVLDVGQGDEGFVFVFDADGLRWCMGAEDTVAF